MQLKDSVFLVTGGASGLGAASARMAIDNGAKVVIADLQDGTAYAKELGANARYIKTNVTVEADGKAAVELALEEHRCLENARRDRAHADTVARKIARNGQRHPHHSAFRRRISRLPDLAVVSGN